MKPQIRQEESEDEEGWTSTFIRRERSTEEFQIHVLKILKSSETSQSEKQEDLTWVGTIPIIPMMVAMLLRRSLMEIKPTVADQKTRC